jgi:hypothetical protein
MGKCSTLRTVGQIFSNNIFRLKDSVIAEKEND